MYSYPSLIKTRDTSIMRYLHKLGYIVLTNFSDNSNAIVTTAGGVASWCNYTAWSSLAKQFKQDVYECDPEDIALFKALVAVQDESDAYQIFIRDEEMHIHNLGLHSNIGDPMMCYVPRFNYHESEPVFNPILAHKATKEELIAIKDQLWLFTSEGA